MLSARQRWERTRSRFRSRDDLWADDDGDDPAAGLVNLFDLWMVFAAAVLLTTAGALGGSLEGVTADSRALDEPLAPTGRELEGQGERLGVAYRLSTGAVVYVPESAPAPGP